MISPDEVKELRKAANQELSKGKSRDEIMRAMVEAGYSKEDVETILSNPEKSEQPKPPKPGETKSPEALVKEAMEQRITEAPPEKPEKKKGSKKKVAIAAVVVVVVVAVTYFFLLNYLW